MFLATPAHRTTWQGKGMPPEHVCQHRTQGQGFWELQSLSSLPSSRAADRQQRKSGGVPPRPRMLDSVATGQVQRPQARCPHLKWVGRGRGDG